MNWTKMFTFDHWMNIKKGEIDGICSWNEIKLKITTTQTKQKQKQKKKKTETKAARNTEDGRSIIFKTDSSLQLERSTLAIVSDRDINSMEKSTPCQSCKLFSRKMF